MNAESKLEQAAKDEALKIFPNGTYNDGYYDMIQGARREGYEECYVKYWQSLTTPESNDKFEFASYLTGHDIDTCKQMYNDYLNLQSNKHKAI